jgi:hypothetical protein
MKPILVPFAKLRYGCKFKYDLKDKQMFVRLAHNMIGAWDPDAALVGAEAGRQELFAFVGSLDKGESFDNPVWYLPDVKEVAAPAVKCEPCGDTGELPGLAAGSVTECSYCDGTVLPAPMQFTRQYYYKVDGCQVADTKSPHCICWHDEGTGPLANNPSADESQARSWRAKPITQVEKLDVNAQPGYGHIPYYEGWNDCCEKWSPQFVALQAEVERRDSKLETMRRKNNELNDTEARLQSELTKARKLIGGLLFVFDDGVGSDWTATLLNESRKFYAAVELQPAPAENGQRESAATDKNK